MDTSNLSNHQLAIQQLAALFILTSKFTHGATDMKGPTQWFLTLAIYIPASLFGVFAASVGTAFPVLADCELTYDNVVSDEDCDHPDEVAQWEHPYMAHEPECQAAWNQSSAKQTCTGLNWTERKEDQCLLHVSCATGRTVDEETTKSSRTVEKGQAPIFDLDDVKKLNNCGGSLKVGLC